MGDSSRRQVVLGMGHEEEEGGEVNLEETRVGGNEVEEGGVYRLEVERITAKLQHAEVREGAGDWGR